MLRNAHPVPFIARGVADGFEQTNTFPGACRLMRNFIFDQANPNVAVARPGCTLLIDFGTEPSFIDPTWLPVHITVGTRIYGMVSTSTFGAFDEPFCYDTLDNVFIPVTGAGALNLPLTQATVGQWNPPTMAQVGPYILITHPGYDGTPGKFIGYIDVNIPLAPIYDCADTALTGFADVPTAVVNYNNRAYYAVNNAIEFSDVLLPLQRTAGPPIQVLTFGDDTPISALAPLAMGTSVQGVLGALIVFKASVESTAGSKMSMWQVTGDIDTLPQSNLLVQQLAENVGTFAPRSCWNTPEGLKFMGADGVYVVNVAGMVIPLNNRRGDPDGLPDLRLPFAEATPAQQSRAAGCYNAGVYRISLDTVINGIAQDGLDFWFDERYRRWNGPHTFRYDCASPLGKQFVLSSSTHGAVLFLSSPTQQSAQSVYTDNGVVYECFMQGSLMSDQGDMNMNTIVETTMELGRSSQSSQYIIQAQDEFGASLNEATITILNVGALWGSVTWGEFEWAASSYISQILNVPWTEPIIFKRIQFQVRCTAQGGVALGRTWVRYQQLGYMNTQQVA